MRLAVGVNAHLGNTPTERAIIDAARARGYAECTSIRSPAWEAQALYRSLAFTEISAYYDTPIAGTVFMRLKLN